MQKALACRRIGLLLTLRVPAFHPLVVGPCTSHLRFRSSYIVKSQLILICNQDQHVPSSARIALGLIDPRHHLNAVVGMACIANQQVKQTPIGRPELK